ncbi:hypothetical protein Q9Q94_11245 [Uliginosibacterium sp. 31-16]|uniref:hypothetical protein n=1 Tax=Uliginosibacterium sp. 31-16 TaxID=3068315 RepID=UPI0027402546|nr:hypothetical protein [Uliginosibacterium sp. 31-16]MDP5240108.1 hypothetical protein [Uliginosibacterium sp. 31-16]
MMLPNGRKRIQLTPRMFAWLGLDLFGMLLFAAGAMFLANGEALLVKLPGSVVEAAVLLVAGGLLMLIAAANLLREALPERAEKPEDKVLGE